MNKSTPTTPSHNYIPIGEESELHLAASQRNAAVLKQLLSVPGVDVNQITPSRKNSALHVLLSSDCASEACQSNAEKCLALLLEHKIDVNAVNQRNETPLYLATYNNWPSCVCLLIRHGADKSFKLEERNNETIAEYVMAKMPSIFTDILSNSVSVSKHGWLNETINVDFRALLHVTNPGHTPSESTQVDETSFLHSALKNSKKTNLFIHPVTKLFIRIKYVKCSKVAVGVRTFPYIPTLIWFTQYCFEIYGSRNHHECIPFTTRLSESDTLTTRLSESDNTVNAENSTQKFLPYCLRSNRSLSLSITFTIFLVWILLWEIFRVFKRKIGLEYFTPKNIIDISLFILVPFTLWPFIEDDSTTSKWSYPVAAMSEFLCYLRILLILLEFQCFSLHINMFLKVCRKVFTLSSIFLPLLVGFFLAFRILDAQNTKSLNDVIGFIGLPVSGPLYIDFFDDSDEYTFLHTIVAAILYVLFLLIMCIVFFNFALAITISDIPKLWNDAQRITNEDHLKLLHSCEQLNIKYMRKRTFSIFQNGIVNANLSVTYKTSELRSMVGNSLTEELIALVKPSSCAMNEDKLQQCQGSISSMKPSLSADLDLGIPKSNVLDAVDNLRNKIESQERIIQSMYATLERIERKLN